jgi:hypothetical protein
MNCADIDQKADPKAEDLRRRLYEGLSDPDKFAEAGDFSPRTLSKYIQQGMPVVYIGRKPYPVTDEAIAWLRNRRKTNAVPPPPRGRGRPRKAAA